MTPKQPTFAENYRYTVTLKFSTWQAEAFFKRVADGISHEIQEGELAALVKVRRRRKLAILRLHVRDEATLKTVQEALNTLLAEHAS